MPGCGSVTVGFLLSVGSTWGWCLIPPSAVGGHGVVGGDLLSAVPPQQWEVGSAGL